MEEVKGESMKTTIMELISYEPNLTAKLEMLTEIGLTTQNDDVWDTTEEIRNELCQCEEEKKQIRNSLPEQSFEASFEPGAATPHIGENGFGLFT